MSSISFLISSGNDTGKIITVSTIPFEIGRLKTNAIVLADEQVSRRHARVELENHVPVIIDLNSRNGVFVNDKQVEKHPLHSGDQLRIGTTTLVFQPNEDVLHEDTAIVELKEKEHWINQPAIKEFVELGTSTDPSQSLAHASNLFCSKLPPSDLALQLLDIFFQFFSPDRAQIMWDIDTPLEFARSRKDGRKCQKISISPSILTKAMEQATTFVENDQSLLVAPIAALDGIHGWIYAERSLRTGKFEPKDVESLEHFALIAGGILERNSLMVRLKKMQDHIDLMEKYVTPDVANVIAKKKVCVEESSLSVEEKEVTILFADIQGFTSLSEKLSPSEIAQLLNEYFQRMVDVISNHSGEVNKFIGDAIMALFGAPKSYGNDAINAVTAGLAMIRTLQDLWKELDERKRFNIRIGINTGRVVAGNIGSERRMEYTVIGDEVNIASRLEGISPPNTITIGTRTANLVKDQYVLEPVADVKVKGKSKSIQVYRVISPNPSHS